MKIYTICITVTVLSALAIIFAYFGYPPQGNNDGSWYIAPGINYSLTGKLESPFYWGNAEFRVGNGPFLSYPPLFPLFTSLFVFPGISIPIPAQIFIAIAAVASIVIAFSAWALYKIATMRGRTLDWLAVFVICASLFMIFRLSWHFGGRPEVLLRLFFTIGFVLLLRMRHSWRLAAALGALLGLAAATHVVATIFFAAFIALAFALQFNFWMSFKRLVAVAAVGLVSFVAVMQLSPFGIMETIGGALKHGALMLARTSQKSALLTIFESLDAILFGAVAVLLLFPAARFFWRLFKDKKITSPLLFVLSIMVLGAYAMFAVANARNNYLTPFFLVFLAAFLYYVLHIQNSKHIRRFLASAFAVIVIISLKNLALFPFFVKDGVSLSAAREKLAGVMSQDPGKPVVLAGSHLWAISESYLSYGKMLIGKPPEIDLPEYFLLKEEWELPDAPEKWEFSTVPGKTDYCFLKRNFYTSKTPKIFGIVLAHTIPSYAFAVYDCHIEK